MVPLTAYARQKNRAALMGAIIFLEYVWDLNYSVDTWSGHLLDYTKNIEAACLSWEFLKVPIMVVGTQLLQGP